MVVGSKISRDLKSFLTSCKTVWPCTHVQSHRGIRWLRYTWYFPSTKFNFKFPKKKLEQRPECFTVALSFSLEQSSDGLLVTYSPAKGWAPLSVKNKKKKTQNCSGSLVISPSRRNLGETENRSGSMLVRALSHCGKQNAKRCAFMTVPGQICILEKGVSLSCKRGHSNENFLFCLSPQFPPISPTCSFILFCDLLYLLLVVCLSILLLLFDASLLNFMCCGLQSNENGGCQFFYLCRSWKRREFD